MRVERSLASNHRFTPPRASLVADSPLITPAKSNKKARLAGGAPANDIQTCTLAGGAPAKDAKRNALAGAFSYVRDKGLTACFAPLAGYLLAALRSASDRSLRKAPPEPFAYARALRVQVPSILCAQN